MLDLMSIGHLVNHPSPYQLAEHACVHSCEITKDLGYDASESHGVAHKARGLCKDLSNLDIFDDDNGLDYAVYGDINRSKIHHNVSNHLFLGTAKQLYKKEVVYTVGECW